MYKKTDIIFVVTPKIGYIPQLRQCGPIQNAIRCPISTCIQMIMAGVPLYQFDAVSKMVVELTTKNIMDDTKFKPAVKIPEPSKPQQKVLSTIQVAFIPPQEDKPVDLPPETKYEKITEMPADPIPPEIIQEEQIIETPVVTETPPVKNQQHPNNQRQNNQKNNHNKK